jgi:F0F1-type ATP synthase delta subunit
MKEIYVQAVVANLEAGLNPETVLSNLKTVLERRGHVRLHESILQSVAQTLEDQSKQNAVTVTIDKSITTDSALVTKLISELGASSVERRVIVDPTIVGGAKVSYQSRQLDATYKTALQKLYQAITS